MAHHSIHLFAFLSQNNRDSPKNKKKYCRVSVIMITSWGWIYINKGFPGHISSILQKLLKNLINLFLKIIFYAITYKPMLVFQFLIEIYNYIELLKWGFLYCSNEVFSSLNQEFFFQLVYNDLVLLVILFGTFFCFFFIYHIRVSDYFRYQIF